MKRSLVLAIAALAAPIAVQAQVVATEGPAPGVEIGIDGGLELDRFDGGNVTSFGIPSGNVRVSVPAGSLVFETLLGFSRSSSDGNSASSLRFIPGVNMPFGEGGAYVRGEVAVSRSAFSSEGGFDDSTTQLGVGAAVGVKKAIANGPVSFRAEAGVDRWLEDEGNGVPAFTAIRALVGISAVVN